MPPDEDEFRAALRDVLTRSGLSMHALSAVMGRDPGYIASLLDPTRPSRARPTPVDLLRASDATGIPFVELLDVLWGIDRSRLADECAGLELGGPADHCLDALTGPERTSLTQYLTREFAQYRIRVNAITPGFFPAEQNRRLLSEERVRSNLGRTPAARLGDPDEFVGTAIWLASDRASGFVTGAVIRVDGGFTAMTI
jgi:hypothetical protein